MSGFRFWLAAKLFFLFCVVISVTQAQSSKDCDFFCYLGEANKASLIMLQETGLVPPELAGQIARGIIQVIDEQDQPGTKRSTNYLDFEARLLEIAGAEASRVHTGRSRQDLHATVRRMLLRDSLLAILDAQMSAHKVLLDFAEKHATTVIPAYTHGVQAQPVSIGHYMLAFSAAMDRDTQRLREAYMRLNLCPLGAAALGTSGFALNRHRLAETLGFFGPIENSYDANLIASADVRIELANVLAQSALPIGQLMQNIHTQYHSAAPWFLLDQSVTDVSSIMPQKRNPRPLDRVRSLATRVLSDAHAISLNAHNTNTGMNDYRQLTQSLEQAAAAIRMYDSLSNVLLRLRVNTESALAEINNEYSTMTEVADVLLREADVPFRTAHHYASELTEYGRTNGKRPLELSDREIRKVYRDAIGTPLPVKPTVIRNAMNPVAMVRNRKGFGGPQPAEVDRMLEAHRATLQHNMEAVADWRVLLHNAQTAREQAFIRLTQNQ